MGVQYFAGSSTSSFRLRDDLIDAPTTVKLQIISDNGPQFIARDSKEFIRISDMTHVRTSPYYPQIERKNRALAQVAKERVQSAGNTALAGRRAFVWWRVTSSITTTSA